MDNEPKELFKKLNMLMARQSVLESLVYAMFDSIPDQTLVINEFSATTNLTMIREKQDPMPEEFRVAYQKYREAALDILHHAKNRAKV